MSSSRVDTQPRGWSRHLTKAINYVMAAGRNRYPVSCYLGDPSPDQRVWVKTHDLLPRRLELVYDDSSRTYQAEIPLIRVGTEISFEVQQGAGMSVPLVPIEEPETVFGKVRIPDLEPAWSASKPETYASDHTAEEAPAHFQILLEATLEGLLADYQGGSHAPQSIEELLELSIAARINCTQIPERLAEMGYTELMVPIFSSVADRTRLDPKFNYLVYNLSLDWQLGTHREMRELVMRFRKAGIELIPDLVFAHQVSNPYDGSVNDWSARSGQYSVYQDTDPFLFRDYGTWMFNLADAQVRKSVIRKICNLITRLDLNKIRVDYIDGLVLQYSRRDHNWGCTLLNELHYALLEVRPGLEIIGEAFSTASTPEVQQLISSSYSPRGFQLMETMLRPGYPDLFHTGATVDSICKSLEAANLQSGRESNYAQLHDECWHDIFIQQGRPATPWAYGKMPLGLALDHTQQLVEQGFIVRTQRLPISIRLTALITVLGMVMSFTRWMETVGAITLDTGRLDEEEHWKYLWSANDRLNRAIWAEVGVDSRLIGEELEAFRQALKQTRRALVQLGPVIANPPGPPLQIVHRDYQNGVIALYRWGDHAANPLLVVANLAPYRLNQDGAYGLNLDEPGGIHNTAISSFGGVGVAAQRLQRREDGVLGLAREIEPYEVAVFGAQA
jgi:hypothetical protein